MERESMNSASTTLSAKGLSQGERLALISLLADEDPAIYRTVREKILSFGPPAAEWLRPHIMSDDPAMRRRARHIVLHFERQASDDHFLAFCIRHGEEFDLEQGAWLFAQTQYPQINVEAYQAVLEGYANELRDRLASTAEPKEILTILNQYVFGELGFAGNEENYYDPENSYLNRVMDRRTGNPMGCSAVGSGVILDVARVSLP